MPAMRRTISKIAFVSGRSRQIVESARSEILANFIQERTQAAILAEIGIDLLIPSGIFSRTDE